MASTWNYVGQDALSYGAAGAGIGTAITPGIGTAIGGGIGLIGGAISGALRADQASEEQDLAEALARGEVDPEYRRYLERMLGGRYQALRSQLGTQLASRGLADSTFAARTMQGTYSDERQALANALASNSMQRMGLGYDVMAQRNAQQAAVGQGIADTVGGILEHNLAREGLRNQQNMGRRGYYAPIGPMPQSQMQGGGGAGTAAKRAPTYPKFSGGSKMGSRTTTIPAGRHQPGSLTGSVLRNKAATGRSGFGQMRRQTGAAKVPGV